jgi:hypothetical protein
LFDLIGKSWRVIRNAELRRKNLHSRSGSAADYRCMVKSLLRSLAFFLTFIAVATAATGSSAICSTH